MKRGSLSVACAIALICLFFQGASWAQEAKKPRLVIKAPLFDAGEVDEGNVVKHSFTVYNNGNAPLEIKNVRPG